MSSIKRITTEYNEQEDRIRLAGLTGSQTVTLWFTMRLMSRLITHCLGLLEGGTSEPKNTSPKSPQSRQSIQNFVQKSAEEQIPEESAVKVSADSPRHLIVEIDVKNASNGVVLVFKSESESVYDVFFELKKLRQWLGMLHMIWGKAEWPETIWPDWMEKDHSQPTPGEISVH